MGVVFCWLAVFSVLTPLLFFFPGESFLILSDIKPRTQHHTDRNNAAALQQEADDAQIIDDLPTTPSRLFFHHTALKTRNITISMKFYSLLGYHCTCRFRAGPARAAWLENTHSGTNDTTSRLELIEVPSYMLRESSNPHQRQRAPDLMEHPEILGYNHLALDVTHPIQEHGMSNLSVWIDYLNTQSVEIFGKTLRIALQPRQQIIGQGVYELAFLYDADGCLVELLHKMSQELPQNITSGWEPWNGTGFVG